MEIIELKDIKKKMIPYRIVGYGRTAICFLMKDGNVFKYYIDTYLKNQLFRYNNMMEHLKKLSELENDTYRSPEKIVIDNNQVVGYIYPYIKAKTLKRLSINTKIFDTLENYDKLLLDTKEVSDKDFRLGDVHSKNILYNDRFYIIDLDFSTFLQTYSGSVYTNFDYNMNAIMRTYFDKIFNVGTGKIFIFYNFNLADTYREIDWTNIDSVYNLFETIAKLTNKTNPSILDIRKKELIKKEEDSYYRPY